MYDTDICLLTGPVAMAGLGYVYSLGELYEAEHSSDAAVGTRPPCRSSLSIRYVVPHGVQLYRD